MCFSLQDPSGTLTRTLPPLNSSFSASASGRGLGSLGGLPPLSGTNGMGDNPLNKPLLAPVKRGEGNFCLKILTLVLILDVLMKRVCTLKEVLVSINVR